MKYKLTVRRIILIFCFSITFSLFVGCSNSSSSSSGRPVTTPTGIEGIGGFGQIFLGWESVSNAISYNIYLASDSSITLTNYSILPNGQKLNVTTSRANISSLVNDTTYYAIITALNGSTESDPSAVISITPSADMRNLIEGKWSYLKTSHSDGDVWTSRFGTLEFVNSTEATDSYRLISTSGTITSNTESITYSLSLSSSGELGISKSNETNTSYYLMSNDGITMVEDGTLISTERIMGFMIRMNSNKSYGLSDLNGPYYEVGYNHQLTENAFGFYRCWATILTLDGEGSVNLSGSLNGDGTIFVRDFNGTYEVSNDQYTFTGGGQAYLSIGNISGLASNPLTSTADNFDSYIFTAQGDRLYTTADLEGEWTLVGFGEIGGDNFFSEIGTITFNDSGTGNIALNRQTEGSYANITDTLPLISVASDGSFGSVLYPGTPTQAGIIGQNGNLVFLNYSFNSNLLALREFMVLVRSDF